jgi:hypothetical protein
VAVKSLTVALGSASSKRATVPEKALPSTASTGRVLATGAVSLTVAVREMLSPSHIPRCGPGERWSAATELIPLPSRYQNASPSAH